MVRFFPETVYIMRLREFQGFERFIVMPREYKKAGIKNQWSQEQLDKAMAAVRRKELNTNQAAKCYRIPYSTLSDHLKDKSKKRYGGSPTVMTMDEEREIYHSCQVLQQFGFPLNVDTVGIIIRDYLNDIKRLNPFANSIPGWNWWEGFLQRWPELVKCKPQHLPKCRALGGRAEVKNYLQHNSKIVIA